VPPATARRFPRGFRAVPAVRAALREHPDAAALGLVVLVAAAIRLAFAFRSPVFLLHDSGTYYLPAHDLVHGLGFDLSLRRPPLYPGFLAAVIATLGEELMAVALAQHVVGILSAALVYVLGLLTFGRPAGLLAALLTAVDGTLLVAEHYVMPEALLVLLLLATAVAAIAAIRRRGRALFAASGVLLGLSVLCKPVAQALIPVIPLVVLLSYGSWRRAVVPGALFLAGLAAVLLPWMLRNWAVHGSPTTAGALGQTLIARTAKHDAGFRWYEPGAADRYPDRRQALARQTVQRGVDQRLSDGVIYRRVQQQFRLSDVEANAFMRDLALDVIRGQPAHYVQGSARMTWQLLVGEVERLSTDWKTQNARLSRDEWEERVEHLLGKPSPTHQNEFERAARIVSIYQPAALGPALPLLGLVGLLSALATPRLRPALLPGLAALALVGVSAALDGPVARYRYPADPLIALTAMGGLVGLATVASRLPRPTPNPRPRADLPPGPLLEGRGRHERSSPLPFREGGLGGLG
jgi:dolichyl-phosphate-mannose-protein mannosyltransferase